MQPNNAVAKRSFIEESRRAQIVDATIATIAEHGYTATTFTRIARHAAISAGLISYHFESKEDLVATVKATVEHSLDSAMGDGPEPESYPAALHSMLIRYVEYCTQHTSEMSALTQIRQQSPRPTSTAHDAGDDELVAFISEGQSYGQFRTTDPTVFASVLTSAMGNVPRELRLRPDSQHRDFATQWASIFVHAISVLDGSQS